jgi:hypothetical protein
MLSNISNYPEEILISSYFAGEQGDRERASDGRGGFDPIKAQYIHV